ncbi:death domain-containing protein 1 [Archocentrus centrarchus]|uniref:death domain-containing protein 1 n=1 Tax=Archocentrus centrarchus TaxID=63155 RepID=UPI0011E9F3AB|nr:death domain-containing protein 1 [Archocentrus centrarchus]
MATNLHVNELMEAAKPPNCASEDGLPMVLTETVQELEGVRYGRNHPNATADGRRSSREKTQRGREGGMLRTAEDEKEDEEQEEQGCKSKGLGVLRELSVFHSGKLRDWKQALRECAAMLNSTPPGGGDQQCPSATENAECRPRSGSCSDIFLSAGEDVEKIIDKIGSIILKLDAAIHQLSVDEASIAGEALQESRETDAPVQPEDVNNHPNSPDRLESDLGHEQEVEVGADRSPTRASPDTEQTADSTFSSNCNKEEDTGTELHVKGQASDFLEKSIHSQTELLDETEKDRERINDEGKEERRNEWITVGLTGQLEGSHSHVPDACFIRAPVGAAEVLRCEVADTLSCLMVTGSEELVSRVIRVKVEDATTFHFPAIVVVPFQARHRGNYRDVAVKIIDEQKRVSYITPVATEAVYGGQKGSFAEVKVYSVGLFAVVSCLKKENYTIPRRGLSLKLPMDPRICLNYLPGSFTAPVIAQTMIQPLDAVLLASVKSRNDAYHSVVSTSPLLYLTHPTSQPLRRPLTVTLPCPPNPAKKRSIRGQAENQDPESWPVSDSPPWDYALSHRLRFVEASMESKEMSNKSLVVLASRDKQWIIVDKVTVRSQQKGLVSFDLIENFDRLLVVRLLSPPQPCHLTSLAEELEESVGCHAVTVILQRRRDEPRAVLVAAVPSRDLSWELNRLRAQGYNDLVETSSEISMREGDQLLVRFSGNITSTVSVETNKNEATHEHITFHSQRKNRLLVHLTEVDPFGNYSCPHYKGTAIFYKVTRGQLEWREDKAVLKDTKLLGDPVCRLSLTLPKKVRNITRPVTARVKLCEDSDSLSDSLLLWLSGELSKEETGLLVRSLRLRRSAAQLVKIRAGSSLSSQAFSILVMWRRGLPAVPSQPKASLLARCLAKIGRPDLARELLLRQAATTRQSSQN